MIITITIMIILWPAAGLRPGEGAAGPDPAPQAII